MFLVALLALAVVRAQAPNAAISLSSAPPFSPTILTTTTQPSSSVSKPANLVSFPVSSASAAGPSTTSIGNLFSTVTITASDIASSAANTPTTSTSSELKGGSIAAIVLGVICALQAVVIAILALRTRNLTRRSAHLAKTLRDVPLPAPPVMMPMAMPLIKPMTTVHVAPPTVVRKVSRKAPPKYEDDDKRDAA